MSDNRGGITWVLAVVAALLVSGSVLRVFSAHVPFFWIALLWAALCSFAVVRSTGTKKVVLVNVASSLIALAAAEAFFAWSPKTGDPRRTVIYENSNPAVRNFGMPDRLLGNVPARDNRARVQYTTDGRTLNLVYTIGANGLRSSSASGHPAGVPAVVFFGCSYTFGEGVNDEETMPWQVAQRCGGRFDVYNFGFMGYGPHQMLAAIESGLVDRAVGKDIAFAIYQALPGHIHRLLGEPGWSKRDPQYVLEAGRILRRGNYDDQGGSWLLRQVGTQLGKSYLVARLRSIPEFHVSDRKIELFVKCVARSKELLRGQHPDLRFCVLFWDEQDRLTERMMNGLSQSGIEVHRISRIIPDVFSNPARHRIGPTDRHPNAQTHELIARSVTKEILP